MRVLVTGGTGYVGRFIVEGLIRAGHAVTVSGRQAPQSGFFSAPVAFRPMTLDPATIDPRHFAGIDRVVHSAFHHLPGRYRGGEGDDPAGFKRLNLDGSVALFHAAKDAGVRRLAFISSRAVYGTQPAGAVLDETTEPHPDTLYGQVKFEAERTLAALAAPGFGTTSLRVTGVYGAPPPGKSHKWEPLFADYLQGGPIAPRCGTEVHGDDVAKAVELVLRDAFAPAETFNVSDTLVHRRDVLAILRREAGSARPLPAAGDAASYNRMSTEKLTALGWRPGGRPLFEETVRELSRAFLVARRTEGAL